ncbi:MAG: PDZ domain-containing protein [Gemmataceae bacterium]|nr:PDZ domain-containing protein [Gemmataceae bacterium]
MLRIGVILLGLLPGVALAQPLTRDQKVRNDRAKVEAQGFWIYNDLAKGFAAANETGKPMLVVFRCIPCHECVKLDDELVDQDPVISPLLKKFVCVRVVSTNGLDLSLFQFDTDQSFAAFMLNADGVVYGRFGTRSHRTEWLGDVSLPGLAKALEGALELHAGYPKNKSMLAGKRGAAPEFARPEQYPALKGKYSSKLDYAGNVVKSCIHCHQIGDAQREYYRTRKQPIPEAVLFPYPHPKSIGLILDPKERATVLRVEPESPAARAGFQRGDVLARLAGQSLLSIADVQWVLHNTPAQGGAVQAEVRRNGQPQQVTLTLPAGWRQAGDLGWRSTSWGLRRMATGGLMLEELSVAERTKAGIPEDGMALRVKHVGQYGPHAAAKQAGFRVGDVLVEFDGRTDLKRETDVLAHGVTNRKTGERLAATVLRAGKRVSLMLPMQE